MLVPFQVVTPNNLGPDFDVGLTIADKIMISASGVARLVPAFVATNYAALAGAAFTGAVALALGSTTPSLAAGNNSTAIANTAYVDAALAAKAGLVSPNFTGAPTAPTASPGDSTSKLATTAFVTTAVAAAVGYTLPAATPSTLGGVTVGVGLSVSSGNVSANVVSVAGRVGAVTLSVSDITGAAALASPAFTGGPTAPTATLGTNNTQIATTQFVAAAVALAAYTLPAATVSTLGGVIVGSGLSVSSGTVSANVASVAGRTGAVALAVADVSGAAPLAGPAFTGAPTAPTAIAGTNNTQIATTAYVATAIASASYTLPAATVSTLGGVIVGSGLTISSGTLSANVLTVAGRTGSVVLAVADISGAAPLASPSLTGSPTAPTVAITTNSTAIATTSAVTTALSGYIATSQLGVASGVATLDTGGKLTTAQIPSALTGGITYKGTWDASTNTPTLTSGVGTRGWDYRVSVAGTTTLDGNSSWSVGDDVIFNGTTWDRAPGSTAVSSVAGRTGAIVLAVADITGAAPLASPTFTGTPSLTTTPSAGDNSTKLASTAYVDVGLAIKANLASPTFTGAPAAPTATAGASTTQIASTAFVTLAIATAAYTLPAATVSTLGGVIVGAGLAVSSGTVSANVLSVAGRTGAVTLAVADVSGAAPLANPTFTTAVTVNAASPNVILNKAASGSSCQIVGETAGAIRWSMAMGEGSTETGVSNAGSDFTLTRWSDGGTPNLVLVVNRNTGTAAFTNLLTVGGRIYSGAPGTGGIYVDGGTNQFVGSQSSTVMGLYNNGYWGLTLNNAGAVVIPGSVSAGAAFLSGSLTINAAYSAVFLNKTASGGASEIVGQTGGSYRWSVIPGDSTAESGSNAGSNFSIYRCNDAGSFIDVPLTILRSTGAAYFTSGVTAASFATTGSITGATAFLSVGATITNVSPTLALNKAASGGVNQIIGYTAGNYRWNLVVGDSAAESGADAGSNFTIASYHDGGGYKDSPFVIARATGVATFSQIPVAPTATVGDNSTKLATTQFVTAAVSGASAGYVTQSGTGAVSRTVASKLNELAVSIVDFGGVGDGYTDNTAALNNALASLAATGGHVFFPPGQFVFNSAIYYSPGTSNKHIGFVGAGADVSVLYFAGNGITLTYSTREQSCLFDGLTITTGSNSGSYTGVVLSQSGTIPNPANTALSTFRNVVFRGADGYCINNYWGLHVQCYGVSNVTFDTVVFAGGGPSSGGFCTNGNAVSLSGTSTAVPVAFNFINCFFNFVGGGIVYGDWTQGVVVNSCNFTGGQLGIVSPGGATNLDQLCVTGCQINVAVSGVQTNVGIPNLMIVGNLFLTPTGCNAVNLVQAGNFTISGNTFNGFGTGQNHIVIGTTGSTSVITGNSFFKGTTGIYLSASSSFVNVQSNAYHLLTNNVVDSGTSNHVSGGSS